MAAGASSVMVSAKKGLIPLRQPVVVAATGLVAVRPGLAVLVIAAASAAAVIAAAVPAAAALAARVAAEAAALVCLLKSLAKAKAS